MAQPTRIVCCACERPTLPRTQAIAPATRTNFDTIRIIRTPRCPAPTGPIAIVSSVNLSWFKQSGKPLAARPHSPDMIRICAKGLQSRRFDVKLKEKRNDRTTGRKARLSRARDDGISDGAEEGTLAVMAGGDVADIERVRPYVLAMARRLTHMGPIGAGQTTKLCNQVIIGCAMVVLAEATRLAVNAGIDAGRLPEALTGGFADSIPLQLFVPRMVQGIHSPPLGRISTMLKDLDTVADVARSTSSPVPMATLAGQLFRLAKSLRGEDADALEIYKLSASRID